MHGNGLCFLAGQHYPSATALHLLPHIRQISRDLRSFLIGHSLQPAAASLVVDDKVLSVWAYDGHADAVARGLLYRYAVGCFYLVGLCAIRHGGHHPNDGWCKSCQLGNVLDDLQAVIKIITTGRNLLEHSGECSR